MNDLRSYRRPIPADLLTVMEEERCAKALTYEETTLWNAIELCLSSPGVKDSNNKERHKQGFAHVLKWFGPDFLIKDLWIPQIREYQARSTASFELDRKFDPFNLGASIGPWTKFRAFDSQRPPTKTLDSLDIFRSR